MVEDRSALSFGLALLCFPSTTSLQSMKEALFTVSSSPTLGRAGTFALN